MDWNQLVQREKLETTNKAPQVGQADLPLGNYTAALTDVGLFEKPGKATSLMLKYMVAEGPHKGRTVASFNQLTDNDIAKEVMAKNLTRAGADTNVAYEAAALKSAFEGVIGKYLNVHVKPRAYEGKTYYNVYVNGVSSKNAEALEALGVSSTDEVPNF